MFIVIKTTRMYTHIHIYKHTEVSKSLSVGADFGMVY